MSVVTPQKDESVGGTPIVAQDASTSHDTSLAAGTHSVGFSPIPSLRTHDTPPGATAQKVGRWIHEHKNLPQQSFWGFTGYQYIRSVLASIPYGMSMALTLFGLSKTEQFGRNIASKAAEGSLKSNIGKGVAWTVSAPALKTSALVATSFTLYRGTSKLAKWLTEYLFNPKDSEEKTIAKVRDLPSESWRKVKEIAPAEVSSTPVAALVLGFVTSFFSKAGLPAYDAATKRWGLKGGVPSHLDWTHGNFKQTQGIGAKYQLLKSVVVNPKARFIEQAAINTLGYSLFFEMGDRLFKDKQIRRGVWAGDAHSTKALKATPDDYVEGIQRLQADAPDERKYNESARVAKPSHSQYAAFTQEPSVTRFVFRRVLPTALGIGAYTAFKFRHAYMVGGDFAFKPNQPQLKQVPGLALLEGAATSLFFLIPWIAEPWEKAYDNFWERLEKRAQEKAAPPNQPVPQAVSAKVSHVAAQEASPLVQQKYSELLDRLNAKEQSPVAASR